MFGYYCDSRECAENLRHVHNDLFDEWMGEENDERADELYARICEIEIVLFNWVNKGE